MYIYILFFFAVVIPMYIIKCYTYVLGGIVFMDCTVCALYI